MKNKAIILGIIGVAICAALALTIMFSRDIIGVSANNIEQDARNSQGISSAWEVSKSINDRIGAMIFYDDAFNDHIISLYVNRGGFSFGYHFRAGGSNSTVSYGIVEFRHDSYGSAIISMNADGVARIEIDNDIEVTRIDVDPTKPFAVTIPADADSIILYDVNENIVPITAVDNLT